MKLNKNFLLHNVNGQTVLVPTGKADFSGVVQGNQTLGDILEILKGGATEEELTAALKERYDAPEGAVEKDVKKVLAGLRKIGALDE